jgi:hypothetical protein
MSASSDAIAELLQKLLLGQKEQKEATEKQAAQLKEATERRPEAAQLKELKETAEKHHAAQLAARD